MEATGVEPASETTVDEEPSCFSFQAECVGRAFSATTGISPRAKPKRSPSIGCPRWGVSTS